MVKGLKVKEMVFFELKDGFQFKLGRKTIMVDKDNKNHGILKNGRDVSKRNDKWIFFAI